MQNASATKRLGEALASVPAYVGIEERSPDVLTKRKQQLPTSTFHNLRRHSLKVIYMHSLEPDEQATCSYVLGPSSTLPTSRLHCQ